MRVVARCLAALTLLTAAFAAAPGAVSSAAAAGNTVTVTNGGVPGWIRFDDQSNGVDAHDGEIKQFTVAGKTKYYLYGTSYGCGYIRLHGYGTDTRPVTPFCGFVAYESTDLRHWTYDGQLFDPNGTSPTDWQKICNSATLSCYRPHMLYDAAAHLYRLWVNTYDTAHDGLKHGYHVLSSSSPVGGFTESPNGSGGASLPKLAYANGGDFDLYQDRDNVGYIVYAITDGDPLGRNYNYKLIIEALSSDYTTGTGVFTTLDTRKTEAPSMFRRGSSYYITMADPNCAYCGGSGTAYLRASSPLGPWRGVGANVALSVNQLYVDSKWATFTGSTTSLHNRLAGLRDYDFAFNARPLPDTSAAATHSTRVGWMFRAKDTSNGYLWILSNKPDGKAPARLYRELVKNGSVVSTTVVPVSTPLSSTTMNVIRTRAIGTTVKTWLNGKLVDRTTVTKWADKQFPRGYAGVRETVGYSSYFDNFSVSRPPVLGYHLYLSDNFSTPSLVNFPLLNTFRRHGVQISDKSCGGQPDDVAMLRAPNAAGMEFLYQSDRWDGGDQNQGQATQYWEPLKFNKDGSIQALLCGPKYTTVLSDATASGTPGALDTGVDGKTPGIDGFMEAQDITAAHPRGQTFTVSTASNLTQVALTLFQTDIGGNGPNADLTVSVYDVGTDGKPVTTGAAIASAVVPRSTISWSPHTVTVPLAAPLSPSATDGSPHQYAVILSTTSTTGAYGTARGDGTYDPDPTGAGLVGASDGTWSLESGNDLRYALTMQTS